MIEQQRSGFAESRIGRKWNWIVPRNASFKDTLMFGAFDMAVGLNTAYGIRAIHSGDIGAVIFNVVIGVGTLASTIVTRTYLVIEKEN